MTTGCNDENDGDGSRRATKRLLRRWIRALEFVEAKHLLLLDSDVIVVAYITADCMIRDWSVIAASRPARCGRIACYTYLWHRSAAVVLVADPACHIFFCYRWPTSDYLLLLSLTDVWLSSSFIVNRWPTSTTTTTKIGYNAIGVGREWKYYGEEVGLLFLFLSDFIHVPSSHTLLLFTSSSFYCQLTTDFDDDDDDDNSLRRGRLWEGVAILRGAGRSTVSISFQFYSCTIISHIIIIHFFFLYCRPMTDYGNGDYDDDSLQCDWHREGVAILRVGRR